MYKIYVLIIEVIANKANKNCLPSGGLNYEETKSYYVSMLIELPIFAINEYEV